MTRDTKIGLLLGLVFIFIIAFLINGVPWLRGSRQGSTQPVRVTRPQPITQGLGVRDVAQNMGSYNRPMLVGSNPQVQPVGPEVRSTMTLSGTSPTSGGLQTPTVGISEAPTNMVSSGIPSMPGSGMPMGQPQANPVSGQIGSPMSTNGLTPVAIPVRTPSPMMSSQTGPQTLLPTPGNVGTLNPAASTLPVPSNSGGSSSNPMIAGGPQPVGTPQPYAPQIVAPKTSSEWPKSYVVIEGDSLEAIAKKHYGAREGIKPSNVKRIFEANKGILKSPERLSVGQKLTIPALSGGSMSPTVVIQTPTPSNPSPKPTVASSQGQRTYTVKEGDSLWKIATSQLGKGTRWQEILKLNADTLKNNEDNLEVGMKLHLPAK
jgi:nucleoid-associated protein YgaU